MPWYYEDGTPVAEEDVARIAPAAKPPEEPAWRRVADTVAEMALGPAYRARTSGGRQVEGAREAGLTMATGVAGTAAGLAAGLGSLPYHAARSALGSAAGLAAGGLRGPYRGPGPVSDPWAEANKTYRQVQEALTYVPRSEEGLRTVEALGQNPVLNPKLTQDLAAAAESRLGPMAGDVTSMVAHPATLLGLPEVRAGLRAAATIPGRALAKSAAETAVKTLGAPSARAGRLAALRGEEGMQRVGRAVLDLPEAQLRKGPVGVLGEGPRGAGGPLARAMEPVGKRLSDLVDATSEAGGAFDLSAVLDRFDAATQGLAKDPFARERLAKVRQYVAESALARGTWTPEGRQLMHLPPEEAWAMRRGLDDVVFDAAKGLRRQSPIISEFSRLRRLVDDELRGTVDRALGPEAGHAWAQANRTYHDLADARRLAEAGASRQLGAKFSPGTAGRRVSALGVPTPLTVGGRATPNWRALAAHARGADLLAAPLTF